MAEEEDEGFDDQTESDENYEEESIVKGPKIPTVEDVMTKDEIEVRERQRLIMSLCCINEAWKYYDTITSKEEERRDRGENQEEKDDEEYTATNTDEDVNASVSPAPVKEKSKEALSVPKWWDQKKEEELERRRQKLLAAQGKNKHSLVPKVSGILYDPTKEPRNKFLQKKYNHVKEVFDRLKEAAAPPFIRPNNPRKLDIEGRGNILPFGAKAIMREAFPEYPKHLTFAKTERTVRVKNWNFILDEPDRRRHGCQTKPDETEPEEEVVAPVKNCYSNLTEDDVDLSDVPHDNRGNPIGSTVGDCEWCGKDILPFPSAHELRESWHPETLFCCDKYKEFYTFIMKMENNIKNDLDNKNFFIDVSKHSKRKKPSKKSKIPMPEPKKQFQVGVRAREARKAMSKKAGHTASLGRHTFPRKRGQSLDTRGLEWDPYLAYYGHAPLYSEPEMRPEHYSNASIVLTASGIELAEEATQNKTV